MRSCSCSVIIFLGCESYRIRRCLLNWYRYLGKCFCSLIPWYTLVPVVKCLIWNLVPGKYVVPIIVMNSDRKVLTSLSGSSMGIFSIDILIRL